MQHSLAAQHPQYLTPTENTLPHPREMFLDLTLYHIGLRHQTRYIFVGDYFRLLTWSLARCRARAWLVWYEWNDWYAEPSLSGSVGQITYMQRVVKL